MPLHTRCLDRDNRRPAGFRLMRPAFETDEGTGISTDFPSTTTFVLALGADLPWADCLYPGNLRFSADGDLTRLCVTYACILSSVPSSAPRGYAFVGLAECSPTSTPYRCESAASVYMLSPVTLSAHGCSTSELLRTLLRNGCF